MGNFYQIHTFFVTDFWKRECVCKKSLFQQGCTKGMPLHTSSSRIGRPRNPKIIFVGKWSKLFTFWVARPRNIPQWNV